MIKRRAVSFLLIPFCYLLLTACSGGGGDAAAPTTTPTTTPVSGKLVPDVRATGYSSVYRADPAYKEAVDAFLVVMDLMIKEIESDIKWESDIPVVFSGCGELNAFFGTGVDVHAEFAKRLVNPAAVFGPNVTGNMLVMCHELTEAALKKFLLDPATAQIIRDVFKTTTPTEVLEAASVTAFIFELQVLFHELGHGMDFLLVKDSVNNAIKQQNFTIPLPDKCGQVGCNTISEDFADWISAGILIEILKRKIAEDINIAGNYAKAWLVALASWSDILGPGGDVAHGFTEARQVNMLCYTYGAIPELRASDANDLNSALANAITAKGLDPVNCQTIYQRNNASTDALLGSFIN